MTLIHCIMERATQSHSSGTHTMYITMLPGENHDKASLFELFRLNMRICLFLVFFIRGLGLGGSYAHGVIFEVGTNLVSVNTQSQKYSKESWVPLWILQDLSAYVHVNIIEGIFEYSSHSGYIFGESSRSHNCIICTELCQSCLKL